MSQILDALGQARTVVNIGAGTGSYGRPTGTRSPSNRRPTCVPAGRRTSRRRSNAFADALPFDNGASTPHWPC